ncbi:MAG: DUF4145 domain-containing protein [Deltaproteobacteria bacterium]|nr:DUF4145 domain-containing protein [Deltaproteobacteria bacterium]
MKEIYEEVIEAYNRWVSTLCAAGLRALIDGICSQKGTTGKNLEARIEALKAILPENIVTNVHSLRIMGNEALHELVSPRQDELRLAIALSEDCSTSFLTWTIRLSN